MGVRRTGRVLAAGRAVQYADSALSALYTLKNEHSARPKQDGNRVLSHPSPAKRGEREKVSHPIRPAKPRHPPATSIHSGLILVTEASTAAPIVTSAATTVWSEVRARINPLAPISPIDSGTSAAWTIAGQRASLARFRKRLTNSASTAVGTHIAIVATSAPQRPATV